MDNKIKSFIYILFSNVTVLVIGVFISFIVPKYITIEDYGYWQLFLLYSSYVGIAIFGYCDGIYVDIGGLRKDELNYNKFSSLHYLLLFYTILVSLILGTILYSVNIDIIMKKILFGVLMVLIIQNINSFFLLINQATGKFKLHSIVTLIEKITYLILILVYIFNSNITYFDLILYNIISKFITLIFNYILNCKYVFSKPNFKHLSLKEVVKYIKFGLPLTIHGIFSMFMTGIGKFFVDFTFDIKVFAMYSFAFSAMAVIGQFISSFSLIMYPYLSNVNIESSKSLLLNFEKRSIIITIIIFATFYPLFFIINNWIFKFFPSIDYLIVLYPMLVFQFKISGLYSVFFKSKKQTFSMLLNVSISIFILLVLAIICFFTLKNAIVFAGLTVFAYFIWYIIYIISFKIKYKINIKINYFDFIIILLFYILNIFGYHFISLLVMLSLLIVVIFSDRFFYFNIVKKYFKKNSIVNNERMKNE